MNENGVWRTIRGRRVFIRDGQDLTTAMIRSGKFKGLKGVQEEIKPFKSYKSLAEIKSEYEEKRKETVEIRQNAFRNMQKMRDKYGELSEEYNDAERNYFMRSKDLARLDANKRLDMNKSTNTSMRLDSQFGMKVKENQVDRLKEVGREAKAREIDKINSDNDGEDKFYTRKDGTKEYDPYKGTRFEKKYDSAEEALNDPNHPTRRYIDEKKVTTEQAKAFNRLKGIENTKSTVKNTKALLKEFYGREHKELYPKEEWVSASEYMKTHDYPISKSGKTYMLNGDSNRQEHRLPTDKEDLKNYIIKKDGSESVYLGTRAEKYQTKSGLSKMSIIELRNMANEYNVDTKGKSKKQLLSALISMFNK